MSDGQPTFSEVDAWLRGMVNQGEDRIWRGAVKALSLLHLCQRAIEDAEALMNDSSGVYGLHLNGDPSPWDELRTGGRFESWLFHFDCAASAMSAGTAATTQIGAGLQPASAAPHSGETPSE